MNAKYDRQSTGIVKTVFLNEVKINSVEVT